MSDYRYNFFFRPGDAMDLSRGAFIRQHRAYIAFCDARGKPLDEEPYWIHLCSYKVGGAGGYTEAKAESHARRSYAKRRIAYENYFETSGKRFEVVERDKRRNKAAKEKIELAAASRWRNASKELLEGCTTGVEHLKRFTEHSGIDEAIAFIQAAIDKATKEAVK